MIHANVLLEQVSAALARSRHATYRLQLGTALGFEAVAELAPYLSALGVSDAHGRIEQFITAGLTNEDR